MYIGCNWSNALGFLIKREEVNIVQGESNSILNQKQMLEDYAIKNGFPNPTHFTDDGISGTRFDRPSFTAMMEEVEAGRIEAIIVKDMPQLEPQRASNL